MTTPWTIGATSERIELDRTGRAEATFTVTNHGPTDQRLVFDVVPGENASREWFVVPEPQVVVSHGQSAPFLVRLAVPAGAPSGQRWFVGRAYSADRAPEETSVTSNRVAFEVRPASPTVPWWRKWWWVFVVAALALIVLVVVLFLVLRHDDEPPPTATPTTESLPVHKSGQLVLNATSSAAPNGRADLDEIVVGSEEPTDILFVVQGESQGEAFRFVFPTDSVQQAHIGAAADPEQACTVATLHSNLIETAGLIANDVICVRTNEGRLSVVTVLAPFGPGSGQLRVSVTTYES